MLNVMLAAVYLNECNNKICASHGITLSQYNVLRILRGVHPNGHPRQEITRRMVDRSPDVTRLIDRLEGAGFVERERTETDRRLSIARITERGLALIDAIDPAFDEFFKQMQGRLSDEELYQLSTLCEKLYGTGESGAR